eukprot:TRINITY_DN88_c0_g1_i2.p1 TRINITY_DN88_c0_g1~~TRINITY_DN88_c0_g1_i2.p1  ORF type:complete len:344 (+),score=66.78 TRINITY_DN88_c0_g1_i2:37-1068(+)
MDIKKNFNNPNSFPDVTVISNGSTYHLHKNIICQVSPHLMACMTESSSNVIDLSFSDDDFPNLSPVIDTVLKYMYTFPIQVDDCYLGLLWSAFNYFQVCEDDVLDLLGSRIHDVSLGDYHSIFRDVIPYNGQTCSVRVMGLLMCEFEYRIKNCSLDDFLDELDYSDQFLLESLLETLRDENWGNYEEKKRKADQILLPLVMNSMGVNHSLVVDYISYIGKIDDTHLLYISDHHFEMNEESAQFFESYVYDHLISIENYVLSKLSFVSKRDSVSKIELRREMEIRDREINNLKERLDQLEGLVQTLPDIAKLTKERICRICGISFTLWNNTPCRFHNVFLLIYN